MLCKGLQQSKRHLFQKKVAEPPKEQQTLWHFIFPTIILLTVFAAALQTNRFITTVAVKTPTSQQSLEGTQWVQSSQKALSPKNRHNLTNLEAQQKALLSGLVLLDLNQSVLGVNGPISKALLKQANKLNKIHSSNSLTLQLPSRRLIGN